MKNSFLMGALALGALAFVAACSSDTQGNSSQCPIGEAFNPITGACAPRQGGSNAGDDAGTTSDLASDVTDAPDLAPNPFLDMAAEVSTEDRCSPTLDSDQDGLRNGCECALGTDPARPDTDRDRLLDGQEDKNSNCSLDVGETDARSADTDGDGANDGDELAAGSDPLNIDSDADGVLDGPEIHSGCMDATKEDTDGDSLPDGVEDFDADGQIGTCPDHMFADACSNGESNPCSADTNGDGTPDNAEVQYLGCRPEDTANLVDPQLLVSNGGDYKLALEPGVPTAAAGPGLDAHVFNDAAWGYAGFVGTFATPVSATTPELISIDFIGQLRAIFPWALLRSSGRRISTHDGFPAVVNGVVELPEHLRADTVRNQILSHLKGVTVNPSVSGTFNPTSSADPMLVVYQIVRRGSQYIMTLAAIPESAYESTGAAGSRVDDLTGGTSVAKASTPLEDACVSYRVDVRPKVDFIWVLDGSGSMSDEIAAVRSFSTQFANILGASNLDWRIAVASGSCQNIDTDMAIDPVLRPLFGTGIQSACYLPFGQFYLPNGKLCDTNGANFTADPAKFAACVDEFDPNSHPTRLAGELTVTMGAAAISRALPRSDTDPTKIRTDAAVVVISVTDEFDDYFQGKMGWTDAGNNGDTPTDPTLLPNFDSAKLDTVTSPFVDYFLRPDIGATVFGIYWVPGTPCTTAAEASAGIDRVVQRTGGTAGSICQSDISATLQQIATASAGIASGLRLRGVPAAPSIKVKVGQVSTSTIVDWQRSRADGWDYDSIVNRVTFKGPNPPQTGDRIVIPYRRWAGSVAQCVTSSDCPREQKFQCIGGVCL